MAHPVAHTLDTCMRRLFEYFSMKLNPNQKQNDQEDVIDSKLDSANMKNVKFFNLLVKSFENAILPTHNTQYVQFLLFYVCSFKVS